MTDATLMLRQVHPAMMDGERVMSSAFSPSPKDTGQLSVDNGDQITPADSHKRYTEVLGLKSNGVWAVSVAEATKQDTPVSASPVAGNPEHCHLDFNGHGKGKQKRIASKLRDLAVGRGKLYP